MKRPIKIAEVSMRIGITTEHLHRIGGTETYLSEIIPILESRGHSIAVFSMNALREIDSSILRQATTDKVFAVEDLGKEKCLEAFAEWNPDVIYSHGILDNSIEEALCKMAPSAFFVHVYQGTCISGKKRFKFPTHQACDRRFGAACLLLYHLRGCGGKSPITMVSKYFFQKKRLNILKQFQAVVTHSFHMYDECIRHGLDQSRMHRLIYLSNPNPTEDWVVTPVRWDPESPLRLIFAGRIDEDKGTNLLIEIAKQALKFTDRQIHFTVVGDGPNKHNLEQQVRQLPNELASTIRFELTGWLRKDAVNKKISETDVVVFPSIWPEPFGLVGPEAGTRGKPVAAFAVGGVRGWLVDGVNGFLAPGRPCTATGLAKAIADCVSDEETYRRLCSGAIEMSERYHGTNHIEHLESILTSICRKDKRFQ